MKKSGALLILLLTCALIALPVSAASQSTTVTATILTIEPTPTPTISQTSISPTVLPTTIPEGSENVTPTVPPENVTTTVLPENSTENVTPVLTENGNITPVTTVMTIVPATSSSPQQSTGNLSVSSSPMGASILIDGVYYGITPANITGIAEGNHIIRLTLSGYYDYEGTIYVVSGQTNPVFGTLPPIGESSAQPVQIVVSASPVITPTAVVTTQSISSGGLLDNPTVVAAIIGTITAVIGAVAAIFPHLTKGKKE